MYDDIEHLFVEVAKLATWLLEPVWMNKLGEVVLDEMKGCGFKVKIDMHSPVMVIVADEVGGNTSEKDDGHVGGRLFLTGPGMVAAVLSSKKDRKFTVLGLTALTGEPVMCVIIIEGSKGNLLLETGIDMDQIEHIDIDSYEDAAASTEYNTDFLLNNSGPGKLFPGGPTCHFKGKEIQSMVRFTESGGINSSILTEILAKLDGIGIYKEKREMGMTPFLLVDGHGSRFELPFLDYIHNPEHPWTVAIGVPYGTAKW
jgi:hypothetical protein